MTVQIPLIDFNDRHVRHALDPVAGIVSQTRCPDEATADDRTAGMGSWRTVGLFRNRKQIFVASYAGSKSLQLYVGGRIFDWAESGLCATRNVVAPYVRRFRVCQGQTCLADYYYFFREGQVWPHNRDIFSYVVQSTRTIGDIARTFHLWKEHARGRNILTEEFEAELTCVAQKAEQRSD